MQGDGSAAGVIDRHYSTDETGTRRSSATDAALTLHLGGLPSARVEGRDQGQQQRLGFAVDHVGGQAAQPHDAPERVLIAGAMTVGGKEQ
jgi:hypothetical protein